MFEKLELLLDEVQDDRSQPQSTSDDTSGLQRGIGNLLLHLLLLFWDFSTWIVHVAGKKKNKKKFVGLCFLVTGTYRGIRYRGDENFSIIARDQKSRDIRTSLFPINVKPYLCADLPLFN